MCYPHEENQRELEKGSSFLRCLGLLRLCLSCFLSRSCPRTYTVSLLSLLVVPSRFCSHICLGRDQQCWFGWRCKKKKKEKKFQTVYTQCNQPHGTGAAESSLAAFTCVLGKVAQLCGQNFCLAMLSCQGFLCPRCSEPHVRASCTDGRGSDL